MFNITVGGRRDEGINNKSQAVIFYNKPEKIAGENTYKDVLHIRIADPMERLSIVDRPAREDDKKRYPVEYDYFVGKTKVAKEGVSIDVLFPNYSSESSTLRERGIFTVEQLADTEIPGAPELTEKAKRYIIYMRDAQPFHHWEQMLAEKDKVIRELEEKIKTQAWQFENALAAKDRAATKGLIDSNNPKEPGFDSQQAQLEAKSDQLIREIRESQAIMDARHV